MLFQLDSIEIVWFKLTKIFLVYWLILPKLPWVLTISNIIPAKFRLITGRTHFYIAVVA
jgi:hypothetical protein